MDYEKLVKTIYEMGEVVVIQGASNFTVDNDRKVIGKVDEYEQGIEIIFEDDSRLWFSKFGVKEIEYGECITVRFYNKEVLTFEKY